MARARTNAGPRREPIRVSVALENQRLALPIETVHAYGMDVASRLAIGDLHRRIQGPNVDYTHYDFLDLPPGASAARIEAAYQTIKQRFHGSDDDQLVRMIHEAYAVLSDAEQRHAYDSELERVAAAADAELKVALDTPVKRSSRRVQDVPLPLLTAISAWAA